MLKQTIKDLNQEFIILKKMVEMLNLKQEEKARI